MLTPHTPRGGTAGLTYRGMGLSGIFMTHEGSCGEYENPDTGHVKVLIGAHVGSLLLMVDSGKTTSPGKSAPRQTTELGANPFAISSLQPLAARTAEHCPPQARHFQCRDEKS